MSLGGGSEIPKGGRAGRARSLGIWPREGRDHGGAKSLGHRDKGDVRVFTACYLLNLYIHFSTLEAFKDIQTKETIKRQRG